MWTRKKTVIGGRAADDDWIVCWRARECGRVVRVHSPPGQTKSTWSWSAWSYPSGLGRCDTLAEGLDHVRRTVIAAGGKMSGNRIDLDMR